MTEKKDGRKQKGQKADEQKQRVKKYKKEQQVKKNGKKPVKPMPKLEVSIVYLCKKYNKNVQPKKFKPEILKSRFLREKNTYFLSRYFSWQGMIMYF